MSDERQPLSFGSIDFGIVDTNVISSTEVENFLGSDPTEVTNIDTESESKPAPKQPAKPKKEEKPQEPEKEPSTAKQVLGANALGDEEEEDEEQPSPSKDKPKEEQETPEPEENVFSSLTKELQTLGVFNVLENEEEIKDGNQFKERFNQEITSRTEASLSNFIGRFGEDFQEAFQAIYIDGVNPREYFQYSNSIESLEDFDLTVVDNQKQILREYYKSIGWASDKISARIQKLEDSGDLEEDANSYHQVLLQKQKTELDEVRRVKAQEQFQKQQAEQQYQAAVIKIINDKIQKKDFDGIPVDQKFAQNVMDYITTNKYRASNGDLLTDFDLEVLNLRKPENYEKKVKIAMLLRMMDVDPTFSKLTKKAISQEKDEAFATLTRQKKTIKKQGEDTFSSWKIN